jgi:hypothetical protein
MYKFTVTFREVTFESEALFALRGHCGSCTSRCQRRYAPMVFGIPTIVEDGGSGQRTMLPRFNSRSEPFRDDRPRVPRLAPCAVLVAAQVSLARPAPP